MEEKLDWKGPGWVGTSEMEQRKEISVGCLGGSVG